MINIEQTNEINNQEYEISGLLKETNKELKEIKKSIDYTFLASIDTLGKYLHEGNLNWEISSLAIKTLTNSLQKLYSSEKGGDRDREMLHFMVIFQESNKEIIARPDAQTQKPNWTIFRDMAKDMFADFTFSDTKIQRDKETDVLKLKIEQGWLKSKEEYLKTR